MSSETNASIAERGESYLLQNYRPQPIALVRGQGCRVEDADGTRYLDLMGGIATAVLGHCSSSTAFVESPRGHELLV